MSAFGFGENRDGQTVGTFIGDPLLRGTGEGPVQIVGGAPPILQTSSFIVFTTKRGTLRADSTGTVNVETGAFTNSGPVTAGTGRYAGATGSLTFHGRVDFQTGRFAEVVRGRICLRKGD